MACVPGILFAMITSLPERTKRRLDRRMLVWLQRKKRRTKTQSPNDVRVVMDPSSPYRGGAVRVEQDREEHPVLWGIAITVVVALATYLVLVRR
jgi:hypothetical protein